MTITLICSKGVINEPYMYCQKEESMTCRNTMSIYNRYLFYIDLNLLCQIFKEERIYSCKRGIQKFNYINLMRNSKILKTHKVGGILKSLPQLYI